MRSIFTALLASLLWLAPVSAQEHQDLDFHAWMDRLAPNLVTSIFSAPRETSPDTFDWRRDEAFTIRLDEAGTPYQPYFIPGGAALVTAAEHYALYTADFSVTLGELVDAGFWPYDTIPAEMREHLVVKQGSGGRVRYTSQLKTLREPQWLIRAKSDILREFYDDFLFRPDINEPADLPQIGDIEPWAIRSSAELPGRLPQFWVNPYTGQPAQLGEQPGDLRLSSMLSPNMYELTIPTRSGQIIRRSYPKKYTIAEHKTLPREQIVEFTYKSDPRPRWHEQVAGEPVELPGWVATVEADPAAREQYLAQLLERLNPEEHGRRSGISLERHGERAPLEQLACPLSLFLAAHYYALATLDFDVTLRDIISAGFWPYDTLPLHGLNLDESLYDFPRGFKLQLWHGRSMYANQPGMEWGGALAADLPSAEWLLWRKAEILATVHQELYFYPHPDFPPADGTALAERDVLPRFAAFWTNPLATAAAGKPVVMEYGSVMGQLATLDVNLIRPQFEGSRMIYSQLVPCINLADKPPTVEPLLLYSRRYVSVDNVEQRAIWGFEGGQTGEVRWLSSGDAHRQDYILLDTGWSRPEFPQVYVRSVEEQQALMPLYMKMSTSLMATGTPLGSQTVGPFVELQLLFDEVALLRQRHNVERFSQRQYVDLVRGLRGSFGLVLPQLIAGQDPLIVHEPEPVRAEAQP